MKRLFSLILCIVIIATFFAGCSGGKKDAPEKTTAQAAKIDYDLSKVSGTVAYSQVYDMMMTPANYKGKTVKVKGEFEYADDDLSGERHYSCKVSDTQGCCQQGIEFKCEKEPDFAELPVIYTEIEVTGTFDTYTIGNSEVECVYLKNATIKEV